MATTNAVVIMGGHVASLDGTTRSEGLDEQWLKRGVWFTGFDELSEQQWELIRLLYF
mgnify:CR=1 FL=1